MKVSRQDLRDLIIQEVIRLLDENPRLMEEGWKDWARRAATGAALIGALGGAPDVAAQPVPQNPVASVQEKRVVISIPHLIDASPHETYYKFDYDKDILKVTKATRNKLSKADRGRLSKIYKARNAAAWEFLNKFEAHQEGNPSVALPEENDGTLMPAFKSEFGEEGVYLIPANGDVFTEQERAFAQKWGIKLPTLESLGLTR